MAQQRDLEFFAAHWKKQGQPACDCAARIQKLEAELAERDVDNKKLRIEVAEAQRATERLLEADDARKGLDESRRTPTRLEFLLKAGLGSDQARMEQEEAQRTPAPAVAEKPGCDCAALDQRVTVLEAALQAIAQLVLVIGTVTTAHITGEVDIDELRAAHAEIGKKAAAFTSLIGK